MPGVPYFFLNINTTTSRELAQNGVRTVHAVILQGP